MGWLSPTLADSDEWKAIFKISTPTYSPASRTKLMDSQIQSEQARISEAQYDMLKKVKNVSISYDGGTVRNGQSLYTVHATTPSGRVMLLEVQECSDISHTGEWIATLVLRVVDNFGRQNVGSFSSDNTGNTRVSRDFLDSAAPQALNLPDPNHHISNTCKQVWSISYFKPCIKTLCGTIKYFKHSNFAKEKLRQMRVQLDLGRGLESIGKTRFATLMWSAISLLRNLPGIRELVTDGVIDIKGFNQYFVKNSPISLQFEIHLTQLIAVGEGFARAIVCLEATTATPADIYFYWVATFFVEGPTNAHLAAFYLHPDYVRSNILRNPNRLAFTIKLPATNKDSKIPPGVAHPKTFLEVGKYLHHILILEVTCGTSEYLEKFKKKPVTLVRLFKAQFTAYAQGVYPLPLVLAQDRRYWNIGGLSSAVRMLEYLQPLA
ncbi:hypothetical protein NMY22_g12778 [Coprinellus aureogranulatus]|nr:hypothetical protein NMY22_g12778 [Coprinellus aureogranulatus]